MRTTRLIARLDIKGASLIKGINLEGVRKIGDPQEYARAYYGDHIDEIIYMDIVASLYDRSMITDIVSHTADNVFVPITVGGGIRSVDDVSAMLRAGADKLAINSAAIARPELIRDVATQFGSQCMVVSIEAKSMGAGKWQAYTDCGREPTGRDVVEWARQAVDLGAGEILLTSIDQEGTRRGFDLALISAVSSAVTIPVIASGGMGATADLVKAVGAGADAIAMADILHYKRVSLAEIRAGAISAGIRVREV